MRSAASSRAAPACSRLRSTPIRPGTSSPTLVRARLSQRYWTGDVCSCPSGMVYTGHNGARVPGAFAGPKVKVSEEAPVPRTAPWLLVLLLAGLLLAGTGAAAHA